MTPPIVREAINANSRREDDRLLAFIKASISERGVPPSMREMARELGITAASAVLLRLRRLEAEGRISRSAGLARGIKVLR